MAIGDLVKFKYHYKKAGDFSITKGDLGLIKEEHSSLFGIYHFRTGKIIYFKKYNIHILEVL